MPNDISKEEEQFLREFGKILVRRIEVQSLDALQNELVDQTALDFGRYVRAARLNAGSTAPELAKKGICSIIRDRLGRTRIPACSFGSKMGRLR